MNMQIIVVKSSSKCESFIHFFRNGYIKCPLPSYFAWAAHNLTEPKIRTEMVQEGKGPSWLVHLALHPTFISEGRTWAVMCGTVSLIEKRVRRSWNRRQGCYIWVIKERIYDTQCNGNFLTELHIGKYVGYMYRLRWLLRREGLTKFLMSTWVKTLPRMVRIVVIFLK